MEAEAAFKPNSFHVKLFNKNKNVFGEDVELKPVRNFIILENCPRTRIEHL